MAAIAADEDRSRRTRLGEKATAAVGATHGKARFGPTLFDLMGFKAYVLLTANIP